MRKTSFRAVAAAAALFVAWALPAPALAQGTVVIYGALSNFDAVNTGGQVACGFEIELDGVTVGDIAGYWSGNKFGTPTATPSPTGGVYVRYAARWDGSSGQWSGCTVPYTPGRVRECYMSQPGYSSSGCDHYGVHFNNYLKQPTRTSYRWLLPDAARPGTLLREGTDVPIPAPVWTVTPATATAPAVVVATVVVPPPPTPRYGDATWVKVLKTELPRSVALDELRTGNTAVDPESAAQVETDWQLVQASPPSGGRQRGRHVNQGSPNGNSRAVVRRYETYAFTGTYDPLTHEALCADGTCSAPAPGEVGDMIGAQIAAANIAVPSITVTRAGSGSGSVGGDGAAKGINCGGSCTVATPNAVGTLTAKADSKSSFAGWGGACAGQTGSTCTLTIGTPLAASATFNLLPAGGGAGGGGGSGGGGGTTTGNVTLAVSLGNPGLVTGNGINCGTQCSTSIAPGTVVTLTATPLPGLAFTGWSGACSGQAGNVCTLTMTKSLSTKAGFSK